MRKASSCLAVLGLAVLALALPGVAAATPTVTFKAKAVPIPGFPHTGNIFGAGAAVEAEYNISGTEYGGFPPPLIHVNFYLPAGTKLHPSGFPTCNPSVLEPAGKGPKGCPKGSAAGPKGTVQGFVAFGTEIVPETASIESFYAPGGGLTFFTFGHEPVLLEILSKAKYVPASGLFSKELQAEVPLVETVPGAQDASVKVIKVKAGSAIKKGGKTLYYGTLPTSCPKKYLPVKTELTFAGLGGLKEETVTAEYHAPCPRKK
ncbi:MAG TPA: hypothetical protein VH061_16030 [Solirubrobacteraceae bacterium]|jgi:hypothetical protein|nr:hypothetical protein [Solirubrobacteraceae bacterium]